MKSIYTLLLLILVTTNPVHLHAQKSPGGSELVWRWTTLEHSSHLIDTRVILDDEVVMYSVIPMCHHRRDAECPEIPSGPEFTTTLKYRPKRSIQGISKGELIGSLSDYGGSAYSNFFVLDLTTQKDQTPEHRSFKVDFGKTQSEEIEPGFVIVTRWFNR